MYKRQVYEQIEKQEKPVYTYGPIIHNEQVVEDLEKKGVRVVETPVSYTHLDVYKRQPLFSRLL